MNKKQYAMMLVLAVFAGFVGGEVASRVFTLHPAFAQKTSRPVEIIEGQEFRLVDRDGKTKARLTLHNGKLLAEIPDLTRWTIRLLEEAKEKE